ncbi:ABC transporter substrate-binding protein [Sinorhizobium medicae]|nr:ABC transporter substrate-binding protein [Sinorhizobium medicae]
MALGGSGMSEKERHLIVAVEESDSTVGFYDSHTLAETGRVEVGFWPHEIEVSWDGKTAYVTNFGVKDYDEQIGRPGASISVIDVENRCEVRRLFTFHEPHQYPTRRAPHGVKLSPEGKRLYVNVEKEPMMLIFDVTDSKRNTPVNGFALAKTAPAEDAAFVGIEPSLEYPLPEGTHNFLFSTDGSTLFVVSGRGGITALDPESGALRYQMQFNAPVRGLVYTPDGKYLIASMRNEIRLLEPTGKEFREVKVLDDGGKGLGVGQILYSRPTRPDDGGKYEILAPAVWESQVVFIDPASGAVTGRVHTGLDPIHIAFSPDGTKAYVTHGRSLYVTVIDIAKRAIVDRIRTRGGPNGIAVAPYFVQPVRGKLVFGACLPLSGPFETEGREIRIGYEYWRERVNAAGGILVDGKPHTVETAYRDTGPFAPNSPEIPKLAEALIKEDEAKFLFGTYPSPAHVGYAKVAEANERPLVIATGAGTEIYSPKYKYVFGIMSPARLYLAGTVEVVRMLVPSDTPTVAFLSCQDFAALEDAKATAQFALLKGFTVRSLKTPPELPEGFKKELVEAKTPSGQDVQVEILTYPDGHKEYEGVLRRMATELDLDLCLATGHLGESVALVLQATKEAFFPRGFGLSVGPALASFRGQVAGQGVSPEHLLGAAQWTDRAPVVGQDMFVTPGEFARAFFDRFSMKASYFSAGGFACGLVLQEALRRAGTASGEAVAAEVRKLDIDTFFARIRFDERGLNTTKPMYTIQLRQNGSEFDEVILWPPQGGVWPKPAPVASQSDRGMNDDRR